MQNFRLGKTNFKEQLDLILTQMIFFPPLPIDLNLHSADYDYSPTLYL